LLNIFDVQVTVALIDVLEFCETGLGVAVAELVNAGGASGVAATSAEFGPLPAVFVPETT
jgi:hypothetical protein